VEIKEHYLWNFVYWVRFSRARHNDAELLDCEKTLEHVAQLVEQVLEGKNPLPQKRGRKTDPDTMWLCFHMLRVTSITSTDPPLPLHFQDEEGGVQEKEASAASLRLGSCSVLLPKQLAITITKPSPCGRPRRDDRAISTGSTTVRKDGKRIRRDLIRETPPRVNMPER
jgi:hypothetical protein